MKFFRTMTIGMFALALAWAVQPAQKEPAPQTDTTVIDADGTAHITRVVPVPKSLSPQAQQHLANGATWAPGPKSPEAAELIKKARALYPGKEEERVIAGVPVRIFYPNNIPASKRNRVLINLHGGGFVVDSGSFVESIPIANLTQTEVISVYYRMAPKYVFPAAVDDVVSVYKEVLKTHEPRNIAIFGTSAGAELTAEVAVRLKHDGLPEPASLGIFSGRANFLNPGDSEAFFAVPGLVGAAIPPPSVHSV
jgi:epsilon-lactone hydrolase